MLRLNEVDAHCAAVLALVPPKPNFLDETLRGFVLHLSAHFQGFCRDLYTECSQICIAVISVGLKATAQAQFSAHLALEKGNPSHDNIRMTTQNLVEPLKNGTFVKILNSGYGRARIAEYRGPLGPKGARVYRVLVQKKPRRVYIEVLEDQLEVLDDAQEMPAPGQ